VSKKTKTEDRVFEQPKGDTPLARAMSIPWVDAGIKPSCVTPRAGYPNPDGWSEQLLVWVKGNGPALGRFVSATSRFVISGYGFGFEVTHWAYITEPCPAGQCKRCGTGLDKKGYCKDETCPHSDYKQDETWVEG
jgi:hypothetical protein